MASTSRAAVARGASISWLQRTIIPKNQRKQEFSEYIARLAIIEINERRRQSRLSPYQYCTITDSLHESDSDPRPHVTIAAATEVMQQQHQHITIHGCTNVKDYTRAFFQGSSEYSENIKEDTRQLRDSYNKPIHARNSLLSETDDTPVGCILEPDSGGYQWYFLDRDENIHYIDKFISVGSGSKQSMCFWNAAMGKTCRAVFRGQERPETHSPDPKPTNLEASVDALSLKTPEPSIQWVSPRIKWGDKMKDPIRFDSEDGRERRSNWTDWELINLDNDGGVAFKCGISKTREFWTEALPGEWVEISIKESSDRPYRFQNEAGTEFKTNAKAWFAGGGLSFFACIQRKEIYLTSSLPEPSTSTGGDG